MNAFREKKLRFPKTIQHFAIDDKRFIGVRLLSKTSPCLFYFSSCLNPEQMQMMAQLNPTLNSIKTLQAICPLSLTRILSFRLRKTLDLRRMDLQGSGTQLSKDLSASSKREPLLLHQIQPPKL